jgi:hypothetical protein
MGGAVASEGDAGSPGSDGASPYQTDCAPRHCAAERPTLNAERPPSN